MLKLIFKKIFLFLLLFSFALPVSADEYINSFNSDITVNPDGTLDIKETITVHHEGINIKRGIYRDLSTSKGETYQIISVTRNGHQEPWFTEQLSSELRLNTGDDSYLPSPGTSVFVIRYKANDMLRKVFNKPYNELYLNITGHWSFPIYNLTAEIHYPENTEIISRYAYQTEMPAQKYQNNETFASEYIPPNHEITIAEIFSRGTVNISLPKIWRWLINSLLLTLFYYILAWYFFGKDPHPRAILPDWEAPKDLSALECAYILNNGKTPKNSFFLHLLWLIKEKAISVSEIKQKTFNKIIGFEIKTLPTADKTKPEIDLFTKNFEQLTLYSNKPKLSVANYTDKLNQKIAQKMEKNYYHKRNFLTFIGALIVPAFWVISYPQYAQIAIFAGFLTIFLIASKSYIPGIIIGFNLLPILLSLGTNIPILLTIIPYISLIMIFKYLMFQPTIPGQRQKERIAGLKMFLTTITSSNISPYQLPETKNNTNLSMEKRLTPSDMEALFPYAVALGIEKAWEQKFKTIFGNQAWKELSENNYYIHSNFTQNLNRITATASRPPITSSSSSPFSSGSGGFGGGHSGGGFGGGGGGGR